MNTSDFDYDLPKKFIAQTPVEPRDASRLLVVDRKTGLVREDAYFSRLGDYLSPGDLLVFNRTRVIPARLFGRKHPSGGRVELLLLMRRQPRIWECYVGGRGLTQGKIIDLDDGTQAEIVDTLGGAKRLVQFSRSVSQVMEEIGNVPLPPYIEEQLKEPNRYQTIFAKESGSVAAPTAGLHFTAALIEGLRSKGIRTSFVTLHIGLDTFAPVKVVNPEDHKIHREWCQVTKETARLINQTKSEGGRIVAIGTTCVRTLETSKTTQEESISTVHAYRGYTDLFILPGYDFKVVDALITNFHLPRSSLLMLVSAFLGREKVLAVYEHAKDQGYRFYSFGDAMLIS